MIVILSLDMSKSGGVGTGEIPSVLYEKTAYATPYGKAIYKGTKEEDVFEFEPLQWYSKDEKPSKFFLHRRDIRISNSTHWNSETIERNQRRDFTPRISANQGPNCICF